MRKQRASHGSPERHVQNATERCRSGLGDQIFTDQPLRINQERMIRQHPRESVAAPYVAKPFTNSTRLRKAIPDGPFAIQGF